MPYILLKSLKVKVKIGAFDAERAHPQLLELDLKLFSDFTTAEQSDHLDDTVNYSMVIEFIKSYTGSQSWSLLEKFTRDLQLAVLAEFQSLQAVHIQVSKQIKPELDYVAYVID